MYIVYRVNKGYLPRHKLPLDLFNHECKQVSITKNFKILGLFKSMDNARKLYNKRLTSLKCKKYSNNIFIGINKIDTDF